VYLSGVAPDQRVLVRFEVPNSFWVRRNEDEFLVRIYPEKSASAVLTYEKKPGPWYPGVIAIQNEPNVEGFPITPGGEYFCLTLRKEVLVHAGTYPMPYVAKTSKGEIIHPCGFKFSAQGEGEEPLAGAVLEARSATGTYSAETNTSGRGMLVLPAGKASYNLKVVHKGEEIALHNATEAGEEVSPVHDGRVLVTKVEEREATLFLLDEVGMPVETVTSFSVSEPEKEGVPSPARIIKIVTEGETIKLVWDEKEFEFPPISGVGRKEEVETKGEK